MNIKPTSSKPADLSATDDMASSDAVAIPEERALSDEMARLEELAMLQIGAAIPIPDPALLERIYQTTKTEVRFDRFADAVATLLDVSRPRALAMLERLEEETAWERGFLPGMVLQHATGGPAVEGAVTGFVRLAAGAVFPEHEHLGTERVLILQGRCQDGEKSYGPGDQVEMAAGSVHNFRVLPGPDFLYLAVVHGGLKVGGMVIGPDDPRA